MAKLIETTRTKGIYGLPADEMIVELKDGRRVWLLEFYGGEDTSQGGQYRWRHGVAIQVLPTDTLASLHEDNGEWAEGTHSRDAILSGYDDRRPLLYWDGNVIERVATVAAAAKAA